MNGDRRNTEIQKLRKSAFLSAFLDPGSPSFFNINESAQVAEVSPFTIYRWCSLDEEFNEKIRSKRLKAQVAMDEPELYEIAKNSAKRGQSSLLIFLLKNCGYRDQIELKHTQAINVTLNIGEAEKKEELEGPMIELDLGEE